VYEGGVTVRLRIGLSRRSPSRAAIGENVAGWRAGSLHAWAWCNLGGTIMPLTHRDLWDTRHLTSVLGARAMPERQVFFYFLAITTFDWLQFTASRLRANQPLSSSSQFDAWFGFGMTVIGVVFLFLCKTGC
jgi:hypothetical protein